jgi:hypothetical protein
VQRDPRTTIDLKRAYVWSSVVACVFAFIVSALMFDLYAKYTQNNAVGILFVILSVGLMIFSIVVVVANLIAINQEDFMWMTTRLTGGECVGRDELDCNPSAFDDFAESIKQKSFDDSMRFNDTWTTAHLSTLHPSFSS